MADSASKESPSSADVAQFLRTIEGGDQLMTDARLFAIAHSLKAIKESRPSSSSDPKALIREAIVATFGQGVDTDFGGQQQFYSSAARAMRRFLVDQGRAKAAATPSTPSGAFTESSNAKYAGWTDILECDAAISELERSDPRTAQIALLRYFGCLSEAECAVAVGRDPSAVREQWGAAVCFIQQRLAKSA